MKDVVLCHLTGRLDGNTRSAVWARADSLMRAVRYESERNSREYSEASSTGWTIERIDVICCLNAFYQTVLGPLASITQTDSNLGLIRNTAIAYGNTIRVAKSEAELLHECHFNFMVLTEKLGIDFWCLQSASARDLLYKLAHPQSTP